MAINEFKPFAATADANVQEQADYEQSEVVKAGFRNGLARSAEVNKAIRQASSIASAVAEFTAEKSGRDMLDDGDIVSIKANFEAALSTVSSLRIAEAEGTSDALSAPFDPVVKELKNGLMVHVRANEKNLTKTPAFKADGTEAKTIVKGNNLSLEEGDIAGAGHWLEIQYDEALDKWVLQNPAKGIISQQSGVPVGTVEYFAMAIPPAGYLKADGMAVGRETYPDLFSAIGTAFGKGDGETTFNLPDLIDRFAQGSVIPGKKIDAGLPKITASASRVTSSYGGFESSGSFTYKYTSQGNINYGAMRNTDGTLDFDASKSSPIYGASDTVQPPALTLLPCIKAFDAATNPGLIDITGLANEMTGKADRDLANVNPAQSFKEATVVWGMPDYSAGISVSLDTLKAGFTAPSSGFFCCKGDNSSVVSVFTVDGKLVGALGANTHSVFVPLSENDVLTASQNLGGYEGYFYPCKRAS